MKKRWWLVIETETDTRGYDLYFEESKAAVARRLGPLVRNPRVMEISERGLGEMIGSTIVESASVSATVNHAICIHHKGRTIWING